MRSVLLYNGEAKLLEEVADENNVSEAEVLYQIIEYLDREGIKVRDIVS